MKLLKIVSALLASVSLAFSGPTPVIVEGELVEEFIHYDPITGWAIIYEFVEPLPDGETGIRVLNGTTNRADLFFARGGIATDDTTGEVFVDLSAVDGYEDIAFKDWVESQIEEIELTPGPQGLKGDTGATGPKGDTGNTGATGAKGDKGDTGDQGIQGVPGTNGTNGTNATTTVAATTSTNGLMSATDKTKLDGLSAPLARVFSAPSFSSSTTAAQLSTTRDAAVTYDFNAATTISLLAGQSVTATLRYADNSGMSTNVITVSTQTTGNSGVLGLSQTNTLKLSGMIPAGKYRQVTFSTTGTGTTTPSAIAAGQEVLH